MNLTARDGIAVREFTLEKDHGYVDYLLFVDGYALGVVEAKPAGYSFTSVEFQAKKYVDCRIRTCWGCDRRDLQRLRADGERPRRPAVAWAPASLNSTRNVRRCPGVRAPRVRQGGRVANCPSKAWPEWEVGRHVKPER